MIVGALSYSRLLDVCELTLLDLRFRARPIQRIDPQVVIVEIGNDTLANLGYWPLPRDYHATLIKVLSDCGVKAVVFDVLFSEPAAGDELLLEATRRSGCVYFPYALEPEEKKGGLWQAQKYDTPLLPPLAETARGTGFANVLTDIDGKRRRIPLFINYRGKLLPQLAFKAACDYLALKPEEVRYFPRRFVQLGDFCRIPVDEEAAVLVNLTGNWEETFEHYSYYDILVAYAKAEGPSGKGRPSELARLKDKVCFVGLTATGTADLSASALEPVYPMIGLQANLFNSLLTKSFLRRLGRPANLGILYILCLVTILLTLKTRPLPGLLYQLGLLASFTAAAFLLFALAGLWLDLFLPLLICLSVYLGTTLFRYIKELHRRQLLEKELSIARDIQKSFLQELPQELAGVSISVQMATAHDVGGDLYDFVRFSDGRLGLMVGDVSGKGIPAALFMAQVISKFRYYARISSAPDETLTRLNQDICGGRKSGLFVTMAYLIYDPANVELSLASAGHLPPLVFHNSQLIEKIEVSEGIPLGLMDGANFTQSRLKLQPQDLVLLYTDGVTEARDRKGREFGEEGIIGAFGHRPGLSSKQAIQVLEDSVSAFVGRIPQHDDITILTLRAI